MTSGSVHDAPDVHDVFAAETMNPIVEIHVRVAVGKDETEFLTKTHRFGRVIEHQTSMLIAGEFVLHARDIEQFRTKATIGRECLESRIDDGLSARSMNDRREHTQCG